MAPGGELTNKAVHLPIQVIVPNTRSRMQERASDEHEQYNGSQLLPWEAVIICRKSCTPCLNDCQQGESVAARKRDKGRSKADSPHGQKVSQTPKRPSIRASLMYGHTNSVARLTRLWFSVEDATEEPKLGDSRRGCLAGSVGTISLRRPYERWMRRIESREEGP